MIDSIVRMATTTVILIAICILGVSGNIESVSQYRDAFVFRNTGILTGVGVGGFIILNESYPDFVVKHEYGHLGQERELGALYLPLVALPSITWNLLSRAGVLPWSDYYNRWPENDANARGDVDGIR